MQAFWYDILMSDWAKSRIIVVEYKIHTSFLNTHALLNDNRRYKK